MYEAWQVTAREDAIRSLERIQRKLTLTNKLKSFVRWTERVSERRKTKIANPFSAFYEGKRSHRTSPTAHSTIPRVLTPTLLPTAAPAPLSTLIRDPNPGIASPPAFEKLYQDHIRRKDQQSARRKAKAEVDYRHCSFSPSINSSFAGSRAPVFDRLSADSRSMSTKSLTTAEREVRNCSFTPQLTSKQYFSAGSSAAALYNHSGLVQRKIRQMQLEAQRKELAKCSFTPQVRSPGVSRSSSFTTASSKSVFEKLFESHGESQHRLREQAMVQALEEVKSTPFRPKVNRPTSGSSPIAAERLFADSKARDRKMAKLREHYSPVTRYHQATGSVGGKRDLPAHERLFEMQKTREGKRNSLTEKVMQEQGVTFAPRLNQK